MNENNNITYLEPLKGRIIRLFKGGPESKYGRLLDVKSDYLVLSTADNEIIFYRLHHLKSCIEDSKDIANFVNKPSIDKITQYEEAEDFHTLLQNMKYRCIRIDRGGPESRQGRLLEVKSDYIVIHTGENKVVYYEIHYIKSISENKEISIQTYKDYPGYIDGENFSTLLQNMKHCWVQINSGGQESIEGVLVDNSDDHLTLIYNQEVYRISTFHIRNVSLGPKQKRKEDESITEKGDQKKEQKKDDERKWKEESDIDVSKELKNDDNQQNRKAEKNKHEEMSSDHKHGDKQKGKNNEAHRHDDEKHDKKKKEVESHKSNMKMKKIILNTKNQQILTLFLIQN
ncbi:spore coat protein B [Caldalkalibacillus uzonensis]|uniref:Spore coat protein B n=1 Tax=Caldalkalibacillus uzonensis TaxID=353224 RepID=A0ABU0CU43_9BACI|nr:hypothetical protein [Caldalkalibacillus uzonensis]MDQ0339030.1 spore coat protein B [Caldalkalibacillus uzonensis]